MDKRSRKTLKNALVDLPEGFHDDMRWDDFVNYTHEGSQSSRSCRVLRVVGPGRMLVLSHYQSDPFASPRSRPPYKMLYLNKHNELVEFDPKRVLQVYREETGHYTVGWERAVGEWLEAHDGMSFRGRGWADACARKIHNLVRRWEKHYSGARSA